MIENKNGLSAVVVHRLLEVSSAAATGIQTALASDLLWFYSKLTVQFSLTALINAAKTQQGAPINPDQF